MARIERLFGHAVGLVSVCGALSISCGGGSPQGAASPPANSTAETEPTTAEGSSATPVEEKTSGAAAKPNGSKAEARTPPAPPSLVELCEQGCQKVKAKCSETAFETCRMNCTQYEHPPAGCESETRTALECARDAEDIPCVNIAPEICSYKFRRVVGCANGKPLEAKDEGLRTPDGWERYASKSAGFAALMPKGVTESGEGGSPRFEVKQGDNSYIVRIVPPPNEKPTQKNMVKVAMGILGKCQGQMKLYGMVERPERVFIRFDSKCNDGTAWRGAFVIAAGKMYMPYVAIPKSAAGKAEVDPFIYSFEVGK